MLLGMPRLQLPDSTSYGSICVGMQLYIIVTCEMHTETSLNGPW